MSELDRLGRSVVYVMNTAIIQRWLGFLIFGDLSEDKRTKMALNRSPKFKGCHYINCVCCTNSV